MAQLLFMVRVPEVEPYVAQLRARFDPSASRGLPAHLTLLHSSLPAGGIDAAVIARATAAACSIAAFNYQVTRVARFPGTLYLAAEPAAPFLLLHDRVAAALSTGALEQQERQPLVPHISVVRKSAIDDRGIEAELTVALQRHGPIACACHEIELLENSSRIRPLVAPGLRSAVIRVALRQRFPERRVVPVYVVEEFDRALLVGDRRSIKDQDRYRLGEIDLQVVLALLHRVPNLVQRPLRLAFKAQAANSSAFSTRIQPWLKSRRLRANSCCDGVLCRYTLYSLGKMSLTSPRALLGPGFWRTASFPARSCWSVPRR